MPTETYSLAIRTDPPEACARSARFIFDANPGRFGAYRAVYQVAEGNQYSDPGQNVSSSHKGDVIFHVCLLKRE